MSVRPFEDKFNESFKPQNKFLRISLRDLLFPVPQGPAISVMAQCGQFIERCDALIRSYSVNRKGYKARAEKRFEAWVCQFNTAYQLPGVMAKRLCVHQDRVFARSDPVFMV